MTDHTEVGVGAEDRQRETIDDLDALLSSLPPEIVEAVHALPDREALIEVVMDLGRQPEGRFPDAEVTLLEREVNEADIAFVVEHIGSFGDDNRAGIERTLHRISAIRNRSGKVVGLTCRVGRAVYGTIEIINDFVETGKSILIMGRPGIGKTTMLREAARVLADDMGKRVVVVDTSNEIAGDGDIPHPAIGKARRMQVRTPSMQHEVMIEAVENHMPQVIVIDEIGTELEAQAARTIAERGVQLIGTAHGNNLDNLMLNPTLSDLIGGIQSVTLGDEEARRRRSQKSVLERKAPPTFDVIVEIQDRERVAVHSDVAETIDALLRGDAVAPELRWRDDEGVHRSQGRPRPSPREQLGTERFSGLVGAGAPWRMEPGWRGDGSARTAGGYREADRGGFRPGYRPGASGGWRQTRGGSGRESGPRGPVSEGGASGEVMPGERFARHGDAPFVAGDIADRGPLERGAAPTVLEARAREARELERQKAWRDQAARALQTLKAEEGQAPVNADDLEPEDETAGLPLGIEEGERGETVLVPGGSPLPTLRVLPQGISRKRLEQAVRDLGLPVVIAREVDEADVVMTLKNEYKQKTPILREAEERAMPIYVLKSNTIPQMQSSLTSIFSLEIDPREAAMRETEDAIDVVLNSSEAVELSPQNAYIRRLQHQMAERANLVSRSRGREPYRRVRLYPESARSSWR
ncbi:MAG TPA: R3H domain-containing nucleic acid-binding protein [Candidatus Limnocylindrales bacterium]|jgi:stage III sporulation protein SpoIIIAA|nr:R3H domain-containing nucleic acid-binding protein [Candidatus Limnocylindrales bacterium]